MPPPGEGQRRWPPDRKADVNKPLWICCLLGAAAGITVGLAVFGSPFLGFAVGLGIGALVGAGIGTQR